MSACDDPLDLRCNTVGYAFPHIECKIIDPDTGEEVPDGVNGEFCSRGYNTMKGYYKMPEATAQTVDAEGWLHSGERSFSRPTASAPECAGRSARAIPRFWTVSVRAM